LTCILKQTTDAYYKKNRRRSTFLCEEDLTKKLCTNKPQPRNEGKREEGNRLKPNSSLPREKNYDDNKIHVYKTLYEAEEKE